MRPLGDRCPRAPTGCPTGSPLRSGVRGAAERVVVRPGRSGLPLGHHNLRRRGTGRSGCSATGRTTVAGTIPWASTNLCIPSGDQNSQRHAEHPQQRVRLRSVRFRPGLALTPSASSTAPTYTGTDYAAGAGNQRSRARGRSRSGPCAMISWFSCRNLGSTHASAWAYCDADRPLREPVPHSGGLTSEHMSRPRCVYTWIATP